MKIKITKNRPGRGWWYDNGHHYIGMVFDVRRANDYIPLNTEFNREALRPYRNEKSIDVLLGGNCYIIPEDCVSVGTETNADAVSVLRKSPI